MASPLALDRAGIDRRLDEIRRVYLSDARPWVIGFSGGKDSTCVLQMVWTALSALPPERRRKPVHDISSDTLVASAMRDEIPKRHGLGRGAPGARCAIRTGRRDLRT